MFCKFNGEFHRYESEVFYRAFTGLSSLQTAEISSLRMSFLSCRPGSIYLIPDFKVFFNSRRKFSE